MANIRAAENTSVLAKPVMVVRRVDFQELGEDVVQLLALGQLEPRVYEGQQPYFKDGFVANDHPRSAEMSYVLIRATTGFGVARTDTGAVIAIFEGEGALLRAEAAVAGSRIELAVEVDGTEASARMDEIEALQAKVAELQRELLAREEQAMAEAAGAEAQADSF